MQDAHTRAEHGSTTNQGDHSCKTHTLEQSMAVQPTKETAHAKHTHSSKAWQYSQPR